MGTDNLRKRVVHSGVMVLLSIWGRLQRLNSMNGLHPSFKLFKRLRIGLVEPEVNSFAEQFVSGNGSQSTSGIDVN